MIPRALLKQEISASALRLWIVLASFCYGKDTCWPSNKALLKRLPPNTNLRTAQKAKAELEAAGLIQRERRYVDGRETSSIYHIVAPEGGDLDTLEGLLGTLGDGEKATVGDAPNATQNSINKNTTYKKTEDGYIFIKEVGWVDENEV